MIGLAAFAVFILVLFVIDQVRIRNQSIRLRKEEEDLETFLRKDKIYRKVISNDINSSGIMFYQNELTPKEKKSLVRAMKRSVCK